MSSKYSDADYREILGDLNAEDLADMEKQRKSASSLTYTKRVYYPQQRSLMTGWTDDFELGISQRGESKKNEFSELLRSQKIRGLQGILVNTEQQCVMQNYVNGKPEIPICSTVGYRRAGKEMHDQNAYVKALPQTLAWFGLQQYDNNQKRYIPRANAVIAQNDMLGSRGMRCVDCIRQGLNKEVVGDKTVYAKVQSTIVFYLTHLAIFDENTGKESVLPIEKVKKGIGKGIIVVMNLNESGYKGISVPEIKRYSGYVGYLSELNSIEGAEGNIYLQRTSINLFQKEGTDREGKPETRTAMYFKSLGLGEKPELLAARKAWVDEDPRDKEPVYLDIHDYLGSETEDPYTTNADYVVEHAAAASVLESESVVAVEPVVAQAEVTRTVEQLPAGNSTAANFEDPFS